MNEKNEFDADFCPLQDSRLAIDDPILTAAVNSYLAFMDGAGAWTSGVINGWMGEYGLAIKGFDVLKADKAFRIAGKTGLVFCEFCKEKDCLISSDGSCTMIRFYLKAKQAEAAHEHS